MGRYSSHLLAVLLSLADVPILASAHPIVSSSLWRREVINISREDEEREKEKDNTHEVAAITGTAIGAGLVFFAACFIVFWIYKRKTNSKKKTSDAERGDVRREQQRGEQQRRKPQREEQQPGEQQRRKPQRREQKGREQQGREKGRDPQRRAPEQPQLQPQLVHGNQERSASESTASSAARSDAGAVTKGQMKEQGSSNTHKEMGRQERTQLKELKLLRQQQIYQQQQQRIQYTSRQKSPHRYAAELPAAEAPTSKGPRRPQMARIRGFEMVLPPLQPPPTRSFTHPLPSTPPPSQPLPLVPTHARLAAARKLSIHALPIMPTPPRPPRPDTPQLPPARTNRPSRQILTTATVTPPRLTPLNTKDIRSARPRAGTGPSSGISPKTLILPIQPLAPLKQRQLAPTIPQQSSHAPQRQQYQPYEQYQNQNPHQYHHYQQQHHHPQHQHQHSPHNHQRGPSQQTLVPSPDSGWSLNTYAGTDEQDNSNAVSASAAATQLERFPVSPESPTGGGTGTVYIAFEDGVSPERTRKTSAWTFDESYWPSPLTATARQQPQLPLQPQLQPQPQPQQEQQEQQQRSPSPPPPPPTADGRGRYAGDD